MFSKKDKGVKKDEELRNGDERITANKEKKKSPSTMNDMHLSVTNLPAPISINNQASKEGSQDLVKGIPKYD